MAGWREALLAQAVLAGKTKGYQQHPQLLRFRRAAEPLDALGAFLSGLHEEALARGYSFDSSKIVGANVAPYTLTVTHGQLDFEWRHLGAKLAQRSVADAQRWEESSPTAHGLFTVIPGEVEDWERV